MASPSTMSKKLGVRAGHTVVLVGAPSRFPGRFDLELGEGTRVVRQLPAMGRLRIRAPKEAGTVESVMLFLDRLEDLERRIAPAVERLHPDGQVWVAWRTRRSADITEELVRRIALTAGMMVTRAVEIDDVWTGVRLVMRKDNREALSYRIERSKVAAGGSTLRRARAQKSR